MPHTLLQLVLVAVVLQAALPVARQPLPAIVLSFKMPLRLQHPLAVAVAVFLVLLALLAVLVVVAAALLEEFLHRVVLEIRLQPLHPKAILVATQAEPGQLMVAAVAVALQARAIMVLGLAVVMVVQEPHLLLQERQ
jgi:hypothetical protein